MKYAAVCLSAVISVIAQLLPITNAVAAEPAPSAAELRPEAVRSLMLDVVGTRERLVAVGERGHVLTSVDGRRWLQAAVPLRSALTAVHFVDDQHGWAVGHDAAIIATADGGRSWTLQHYQPELKKPLLDVLFLDARLGYAVGAFGLLLKTEDGGGSWTEVRVPEIDADELNLQSLTRLGNGDLLITGEQGRLLLSSDRGLSWSQLATPLEVTVFGAAAIGASGALICGLRGQAWISGNPRLGGWQRIATGTQAGLYGCAATDATHAALVGLDGTILIADCERLRVRRYQSPSPLSWSAVARWRSGLVLAGEAGLYLLGPVP